jgi:hypothetical protein
MHAIVHPASLQDRDGGALLMATLFGLHPFLLKLYADGGYQGPLFQRAAKKALSKLEVEIVKRCDRAKGFVVLPKRWIVEGWPRTGNASTAKPSPSSTSPRSGSCSENYATRHDLFGQTLRMKLRTAMLL